MIERAQKLLTATLFGSLAAYALFLSVCAPFHNWDAVAYIAAAESFEQADKLAVHEFAYKSVRDAVSDEAYAALARPLDPGTTNPGIYRHAMSTDAEAFGEQLPFYEIRPAYTFSIFLLYKAGIQIESTTYLIPGVAAACAILLFYLMTLRWIEFPLTLALPALGLFFGVLDLGRYSTPDGLAFFAILLVALIFLKQRFRLLLLVLPAILAIRGDLILFTLPILLCLFVWKETSRLNILLSAVVSVLLIVVVATYWHNPGWQTQFYCSTVERCIHPLSQPPVMTAEIYVDAVRNGFDALIRDRNFVLYLMSLAALFGACAFRMRTTPVAKIVRSAPVVLAFVSLAYIVARFLILPSQWDRFFVAPYLLTAWAALATVSAILRERRHLRASRLDSSLLSTD